MIDQPSTSTDAGRAHEMGFETSFGVHRLRLEPPDMLHIVFGGRFTVEEARALVQCILEMVDRCGPLLVCVDVAQFRMSGPKVREVFANAGGRSYRVRAAAICGASFTIRTAMNMVMRAGQYLNSGAFAFPVEFVDTEADARDWLAKMKSA